MPAAFVDEKDISSWAKGNVYFMAANKIINGAGGNKFAPKNVVTEEQATGYANATREAASMGNSNFPTTAAMKSQVSK